MINLMNGTTVVTLSSNNAVAKREKPDLPKNNNITKQDSFIKNDKPALNNVVSGDDEKNIDYQEEAVDKLQRYIQKDYLERNYYIDEESNIPVLQLINNETDSVIGQYPADLYLNLIMKVRENQKEMVNQKS